MTIPLRYSNNANIKYPLSDFHEEDIPNDILLNLSVTVPEGSVPVMSILQVTAFTAFMAIEDANTNALLGSVLVTDPITARVYPMDMDVDGHGYVVFGPGLRNAFNSGNVSVPLDPDTVIYAADSAAELQLEVNGVARGIRTVLGIDENTDALLFTVEGNTIYIDRNDAALTQDQIDGFSDLIGTDDDEIITSVAGALPDEAGNILIVFREEDYINDCPDVYTLQPTRTLDGTNPSDSLPLDIMVIPSYDPDYECVDVPDPPPPDPDTGPQNIKTAIILDLYDDNQVGVLYSKRGDDPIPGSAFDGGRPGTEEDDYEYTIDALNPANVEVDYETIIDAGPP